MEKNGARIKQGRPETLHPLRHRPACPGDPSCTAVKAARYFCDEARAYISRLHYGEPTAMDAIRREKRIKKISARLEDQSYSATKSGME
jgi:hypothetical protein